MFRGPSFIVSTMQEETTPIFKRLWYDWTQQQPGIEPTNPLGQCWVPPIVAFYDQQGLLRTYSLPGGSIRSPHPGSPRGRPVMFRGPSFILSTMQEETTPIFERLWYDWTQQQLGIEPTNPLCQCWVSSIVAFYDQQGLLRTYSLPGGSIRSPHPGSPQGSSRPTPLKDVRETNSHRRHNRRRAPGGCGDGGDGHGGERTISPLADQGERDQLPGRHGIRGVNSGGADLEEVGSCRFVCGISLTSGQLFNELLPDCKRSCFSQVVLHLRGGDRIYEMRCLFVAVGPKARFIVLPHWDNMS